MMGKISYWYKYETKVWCSLKIIYLEDFNVNDVDFKNIRKKTIWQKISENVIKLLH